MTYLALITTQENDTFYIKKYNTYKRIDVQLTNDDDVTVINPENVNVTFTLGNDDTGDELTVSGLLSDIYGTASLSLSYDNYQQLDSDTSYTVSVALEQDGTTIPVSGSFTLIVKKSQV